MMGKHSARLICVSLLCLAAPPALAQPAPSGGVDVKVRLDDFIESYAASKTSFAFLIRDISFGYEISGAGRGALGDRKFSIPRADLEQAITPGREPRGVIIQKGPDDQPVLRIRMAGQKGDIVVRAKFIRSSWDMFAEGKTITIIAPAADLQTLPGILTQVASGIAVPVKEALDPIPSVGIEDLQLRTNRLDGDQVIIQGNNRGFTVSYPSITATYSAELKSPSVAGQADGAGLQNSGSAATPPVIEKAAP